MLTIALKINGKSILDRIICAATHGPASHAEVSVGYRGWFSFTLATGGRYIPVLPANEEYRHIDVPFMLTPTATAWADSMIGHAYDTIALAHWVIGSNVLIAGTEICSQAVADLLSRCDCEGERPTLPAIPSPNDLWRAFLPHETCAAAPDPEIERLVEAMQPSRKVGGPFGIDMTSINATMDAVKALAEKASAFIDAGKPLPVEIIGGKP